MDFILGFAFQKSFLESVIGAKVFQELYDINIIFKRVKVYLSSSML